jgi:hypothetical protein
VRDEWTKKLPDDRTVIYTSEIDPRDGGMITAWVDAIIRTRTVEGPMTREEVEAEFKNL